jgi:hypothetical protein
MRKRHAYRADSAALAAGGAYEGQTVRLDRREVEPAQDSSARAGRGEFCARAFPWWTLWLIWPLFAAFKGLAAPLPAALVGLGGLPPVLAAAVAVLLIAIGWLLVRRG